MRIIAEEVDGVYYQDVILTSVEATSLLNGHVIEGMSVVGFKRIHTGLRIGEKWIYDETNNGILTPEGE